jgi:hypothetical protein
MSIRGTVGYYVADKRQAENYSADQKTIINLLNQIPKVDGGQEGSLRITIKERECTQPLLDAIWAFQRKNFDNATGVIEPRSAMLSKLEELAYEATPKGGNTPLEMLQDSLSDFRAHYRPQANEKWSAGDSVQRDVLAHDAWQYIEGLERYRREERFAVKELPAAGYLFGNALITPPRSGSGDLGIPIGQRARIRYRGMPINYNCQIETTDDDGPALVLFKDCTGIFLPSGTHLDWHFVLNRFQTGQKTPAQRLVVLPDAPLAKVAP